VRFGSSHSEAETTSHTPTSISPDGSTLLYEAIKTAGDRTAWSFSLKDRRASMFQEVQASNIVISPTFAPNGRWIAVSSNRGADGIGAATVFVMPFPLTGAKYLVARAAHPAWSPDGNELFFRRAGELFVVPVKTQPAFAVGDPVQLPSPGARDRGGQFQRDYDLLRDGQHIVAVVQPGEGGGGLVSSQIEVVLDWTEELKQRLSIK
jgi:WD40 repeat protein